MNLMIIKRVERIYLQDLCSIDHFALPHLKVEKVKYGYVDLILAESVLTIYACLQSTIEVEKEILVVCFVSYHVKLV